MSDRPPMLGPYPVERELGRGGMGVVYLARDPKLDRPVAIKVLPDEFARDPERLARFEREARLLASLNHPNVAGIYGIEEAAGKRLLILEYIPGDTLAARTTRSALPLDEALDVCRQIALAVEAAHDGGVIHRDLKPGNVKITPDGQVKVLDFGLAKGGAGGASSSAPDLSQSPTITFAATGAGVILGTAAYMSPEQARGRAVDKRTDIWSFGCVLYECLTGGLAFGGETVSDTIARILEREPDWSALPSQTPATVRELLRRCLEKDAKKRQRDIGDVRLELEEAIAARSTATRAAAAAAEARSRAALSPRVLGLVAVALVLGAAAGIGLWQAAGPGAGTTGRRDRPVHLSLTVPPAIRVTAASLAPDGRTVVAIGWARKPDGTEERRPRLYARALDDYALEPIAGTEGISSYAHSPDGRWVAFVSTLSEESSQSRLSKVPVDGSSPPVVLSDWDDGWNDALAWLEDGDLLIITDANTRFFRQPTGGGAAKPAVKLDTGGATAFFSLGAALPGNRGVFINASGWGPRGFQGDLWLLDHRSGKAQRLFENAGNAVYSSTGHLLFARGEALMAAPFDLGRLMVTGNVIGLTDGARTPNSWDHALFDVSRSGSLFYAPGGRVGGRRALSIAGEGGAVTPFASERRAYEGFLSLSPDGRKASVVVPNARATYETWVADPDRPGLRRAIALPTADCAGTSWSPDARLLAFNRQARDKDDGVYLQPADGSAPPRPVVKVRSEQDFLNVDDWTPDGRGLLVDRWVGGKGDVLLVPVAASGDRAEARPLLASPASEYGARFSPDGNLLAFISDESGQYEAYVARYLENGALGPPVMVSEGGATAVRWSGRKLYYYTEPDRVMSVAVSSQDGIRSTAPTLAFDMQKLRAVPRTFSMLGDGRMLFIQKGEEEDDVTQFNVILGWSEELRTRMKASRVAGGSR